MDIGPAGSRAMGLGNIGPGPVLDARAFPVPIPKVCTSCRTNIHVVITFMHPKEVLVYQLVDVFNGRH